MATRVRGLRDSHPSPAGVVPFRAPANKRVCIITAGQLSTTPRMLKAADALTEVGYVVRVVSTLNLPWATRADREIRKIRAWSWTPVDYDRRTAFLRWLYTGFRQKACLRLMAGLGPGRSPFFLLARAIKRVHTELVSAATREPADLFFAAGLVFAVAVEASRRTGTPYAIDLEDFHSGEMEDTGQGRLFNQVAEALERKALHGAKFLLAASAGISQAYKHKYGVTPITINNTFPLPQEPPSFQPTPGLRLRLYWFSQTIGPGRGLEDAIRAMGLAGIQGELHLRGQAIPDYMESLIRSAGSLAPALKVVHHHPALPDSMVDLCAGCDVGLAIEPGFSPNNRIALSNKVFTYILAGLAVVLTDTPGQRVLAADLGEGAIVYASGDVSALAAGLKRWADDKALLARAKRAAWQAGQRRWHWEHPLERGALLGAVEATLR